MEHSWYYDENYPDDVDKKCLVCGQWWLFDESAPANLCIPISEAQCASE